MSGGFRVDPDALDRAGKRIGALRAKVDSVEKKVTDANVPSISWGLLGISMHADYEGLLSQFRSCLKQAATGVERAGDKLSRSGAAYREADVATRTGLDKLGKELQDSAGPKEQ
ncbi:type VII secretion target [Allokutzneria albata]|uniref:Excreted virulence factor EspC, type VII ESX diderm n=1 Tax=Allokutzneria albata TaxID=211114 RepID=A0A1G9YZU9_ALLAB|nr:type VII secretion target [Allokutzneria albata]SDN14457.1 Excreted virulence factor EspC, type VII ESX diderm [Allokutzneria albata]